MTNQVHFIVMQARLAHTGVTHLHWSFSVDQDAFSPQYTLPLVLATTPRLVYLEGAWYASSKPEETMCISVCNLV